MAPGPRGEIRNRDFAQLLRNRSQLRLRAELGDHDATFTFSLGGSRQAMHAADRSCFH